MCIGDVAMKVCIRFFLAFFKASDAASMSFSNERASAHIVDFLIVFEISDTALKSPLLAIGKPASIISTLRSSKASAI